MKKVFLLLSAAILAFSCTENENVNPDNGSGDNNGGDNSGDQAKTATLTFEDADYTAPENYVGESNWSSLIDNKEYAGDLLYTDMDPKTSVCHSEYAWYDKDNTELASEIIESSGSTAYWNGGIAVSNYYTAVTEETKVSSDNQLSVAYKDADGKSGYNGSDNFAVVSSKGYLYFGDDKARTIKELYVIPTSYWLSVAQYGDGYYTMTGLGDGDWATVTATSVDAEGKTLETSVLYIAKDGKVAINEWTAWDLSSLGEVTKVIFTTDSSVTNDYGSVLPNYIAIDNVVVEL